MKSRRKAWLIVEPFAYSQVLRSSVVFLAALVSVYMNL